MLKWHGMMGILLIAFAEANFMLRIEPFIFLSYPIVWFGYIFFVDSVVHRLRGNSLISSRFPQFLGMVMISGTFWWFFEFLNIPVQNWTYIGIENLGIYANLFAFVSFATVLPALFETVELMKSLRPYKARKKSGKVSKNYLHAMIAIGVLCFVLPVVMPGVFYPLIWGAFFFLLDPINYSNNQPSIIGHLKKGNRSILVYILIAGIILGILWEFWNYWAVVKWVYDVPFVNFLKIFEMPVLGYIGYFPFALELYAMYWFTRSLFIKKEKLIEE